MTHRRLVNPKAAEAALALHAAAIHLLRRLRRADKESGIPPAQLSALSVLVFGGPQRLSTLAEIEEVAAPTMSRIVAGLQKAKLIARSADPDDGRAETIAPTALGRQAMLAARDSRLHDLTAFLSHGSAGDMRALQRTVTMIQGFLAG